MNTWMIWLLWIFAAIYVLSVVVVMLLWICLYWEFWRWDKINRGEPDPRRPTWNRFMWKIFGDD